MKDSLLLPAQTSGGTRHAAMKGAISGEAHAELKDVGPTANSNIRRPSVEFSETFNNALKLSQQEIAKIMQTEEAAPASLKTNSPIETGLSSLPLAHAMSEQTSSLTGTDFELNEKIVDAATPLAIAQFVNSDIEAISFAKDSGPTIKLQDSAQKDTAEIKSAIDISTQLPLEREGMSLDLEINTVKSSDYVSLRGEVILTEGRLERASIPRLETQSLHTIKGQNTYVLSQPDKIIDESTSITPPLHLNENMIGDLWGDKDINLFDYLGSITASTTTEDNTPEGNIKEAELSRLNAHVITLDSPEQSLSLDRIDSLSHFRGGLTQADLERIIGSGVPSSTSQLDPQTEITTETLIPIIEGAEDSEISAELIEEPRNIRAGVLHSDLELMSSQRQYDLSNDPRFTQNINVASGADQTDVLANANPAYIKSSASQLDDSVKIKSLETITPTIQASNNNHSNEEIRPESEAQTLIQPTTSEKAQADIENTSENQNRSSIPKELPESDTFTETLTHITKGPMSSEMEAESVYPSPIGTEALKNDLEAVRPQRRYNVSDDQVLLQNINVASGADQTDVFANAHPAYIKSSAAQPDADATIKTLETITPTIQASNNNHSNEEIRPESEAQTLIQPTISEKAQADIENTSENQNRSSIPKELPESDTFTETLTPIIKGPMSSEMEAESVYPSPIGTEALKNDLEAVRPQRQYNVSDDQVLPQNSNVASSDGQTDVLANANPAYIKSSASQLDDSVKIKSLETITPTIQASNNNQSNDDILTLAEAQTVTQHTTSEQVPAAADPIQAAMAPYEYKRSELIETSEEDKLTPRQGSIQSTNHDSLGVEAPKHETSEIHVTAQGDPEIDTAPQLATDSILVSPQTADAEVPVNFAPGIDLQQDIGIAPKVAENVTDIPKDKRIDDTNTSSNPPLESIQAVDTKSDNALPLRQDASDAPQLFNNGTTPKDNGRPGETKTPSNQPANSVSDLDTIADGDFTPPQNITFAPERLSNNETDIPQDLVTPEIAATQSVPQGQKGKLNNELINGNNQGTLSLADLQLAASRQPPTPVVQAAKKTNQKDIRDIDLDVDVDGDISSSDLRDIEVETDEIDASDLYFEQLDTEFETTKTLPQLGQTALAPLAIGSSPSPVFQPLIGLGGEVMSPLAMQAQSHTSSSSALAQSPSVRQAVVTTVTDAILTAKETPKGLVVQLDPPEMGRVYIDFLFEGDNNVTVIVKSDSADSQAILKERQDHFQAMLKESGFENVTMSFEQQDSNGREGSDSDKSGKELNISLSSQAAENQSDSYNHPIYQISNDAIRLDMRL